MKEKIPAIINQDLPFISRSIEVYFYQEIIFSAILYRSSVVELLMASLGCRKIVSLTNVNSTGELCIPIHFLQCPGSYANIDTLGEIFCWFMTLHLLEGARSILEQNYLYLQQGRCYAVFLSTSSVLNPRISRIFLGITQEAKAHH